MDRRSSAKVQADYNTSQGRFDFCFCLCGFAQFAVGGVQLQEGDTTYFCALIKAPQPQIKPTQLSGSGFEC